VNVVVHQYQRTLQHALDILFPPRCIACKRSGSVLCSSCLAAMQPLAPLPYKQHPHHMSGLHAVNMYEGSLRSCIHALKYEGVTRLAEPLGTLLAQAYLNYGMRADMMVSVPLHSERQRKRGYNHAQLLASVCASRVNVPLRDDVLVRSRATAAQVGLRAYERQQNVQGAFLATPTTREVYGRRIIIIDDVCTTGATLEACATALFNAGAYSVWGLVLARSAV